MGVARGSEGSDDPSVCSHVFVLLYAGPNHLCLFSEAVLLKPPTRN